MYALHAGDHREPDVPSYRGRTSSLDTTLLHLEVLQRDISYDWWYVRDDDTDQIVAKSEEDRK